VLWVTRINQSTLARRRRFHPPEFFPGFSGARIVKLERNYRSTQNILDAAGAVVANILSGWANR